MDAHRSVALDRDLLLDRVRMAGPSELDDLARDLKIDVDAFDGLSVDAKCARLADELRSVAGHTLMNVSRRVRGLQLSYRDILIDVADKLTPGVIARSGFHVRPEADEATIEDYIATEVQRRAAERLKALPPEDRCQLQSEVERKLREQGSTDTAIKAASVAVLSGNLSGMMLATATSAALYSSLWTTLAGLSARQVLVGGLAVGGPVGVLAGILMFATSPSYTKTIPTVIRLAFIRQSYQQRQALMQGLP